MGLMKCFPKKWDWVFLSGLWPNMAEAALNEKLQPFAQISGSGRPERLWLGFLAFI